MLIRRECFDALGAYDEDYNLAEDLELWFRFGQRFRLANLSQPLTWFRVSGGNVTLQRQRAMIHTTLRVRYLAITHYGYHPSFAGYMALLATWTMQFLPAKMVYRLFHRWFLPYGAFLWRKNPSS